MKTQKLIESAIDKSDNAGVDEQDLKELIEDYQALPAGERPKAIEALVYLEKHGIISPPLSGLFLGLLPVQATIQ